MAIYHYTLRSETKKVDGITIGRYGFAYKESSSMRNYPGGPGRKVSAAEHHAHNALYQNRNVRHFVMADSFAEATQDGYFVFKIEGEPPISSTFDGDRFKVVGMLRKVGGRYTFIRKEPVAA